jgi:hypothetical protein
MDRIDFNEGRALTFYSDFLQFAGSRGFAGFCDNADYISVNDSEGSLLTPDANYR